MNAPSAVKLAECVESSHEPRSEPSGNACYPGQHSSRASHSRDGSARDDSVLRRSVANTNNQERNHVLG
jgi:hypothetical protein